MNERFPRLRQSIQESARREAELTARVHTEVQERAFKDAEDSRILLNSGVVEALTEAGKILLEASKSEVLVIMKEPPTYIPSKDYMRVLELAWDIHHLSYSDDGDSFDGKVWKCISVGMRRNAEGSIDGFIYSGYQTKRRWFKEEVESLQSGFGREEVLGAIDKALESPTTDRCEGKLGESEKYSILVSLSK